jgi:hypothetical protein
MAELGEDGKAAGLASVVAAATALVTGVGALTLTGTLGRVQRNHGMLFAIALGVAVVGAGIWLGSSLISLKARPIRRRGWTLGRRQVAQGLAAILTVVGVALGFITAVITANDTEQPTVTVKLDDESLALTGTAAVNNLSSADRLGVVVDGLSKSANGYRIEENLSHSLVGPDGEGKAKTEFDVQVPPGRFDAVGVKAFTDDPEPCGVYRRKGEKKSNDGGTGCVVLPLPARPARPQLSATWAGNGRAAKAVILRFTIANAAGGGPAGELMALNVVGMRKARRVKMYRAVIAPPAPGGTERSVRLPVDPAMRVVCAQASAVGPGEALPSATCPIGAADAGVATVQLRVPDP